MLTKEQCKKMLFNLGIKFGVAPKLISERLLSEDDKQDMLNGLISLEMLETATKAWINAKLPNYAKGEFEPIERFWEKCNRVA